MIVLAGVGILFTIYFGLQLWFWWVWKFADDPTADTTHSGLPAVTILIPVRNEEHHIARCLRSLQAQNYPKDLVQILVVNDHSTDHTVHVVREFPDVEILHLAPTDEGKKKAIARGVESAGGDIVLTIDGDCEVGPQWLMAMIGALMEPDARDAVTGPVWMVPQKPDFVQKYQEMEQASLNVITFSGWKTGTVFSASGANMAYRKSCYHSLNPYDDNDHIPSGDDVFFVHKMVKAKRRLGYVRRPEALVYTSPADTMGDFMDQRLRWAGKSPGYSHGWTRLYLGVFGSVQILLFVLIFAMLWYPEVGGLLLYGLAGKFLVDYLIIGAGMKWGRKAICWQDALKASLFQMVYVNYTMLLWLLGREVRWKGR